MKSEEEKSKGRITAPVVVDDGEISLEDLLAVAFSARPVHLSTEHRWRQKLQEGRLVIERSLAAGHKIYGVSTGVGYSSGQTIDADHTHEFAYQIIRQHGCGLGAMLTVEEGRAVVFARLVSLAKGYSAVRPELLQALCDLLNYNVIPVIPSLGSVGASGDLTPLSYLASVLAGEREAYYQGAIRPASEALKDAGLSAHVFVPKESLAIMNGTAVMTALGTIVAERFSRTLAVCEAATALSAEVLHGRSQAFAAIVHRLKHHPGQIAAAKAIRTALHTSRMIDSGKEDGRMVQDPYSIRCAPHVIGAARDALTWSQQVLGRELNSVNDNPIVDAEGGEMLFAGNFYGGHVALTMDLVKIAAASVADLMDRQYALLVDARLNVGLPETLVGYHGCGVKALQLTSSALTAMAVQRAFPDTLLSRPTEANNQDKVSMGQNAALNAADVMTFMQQVTASLLVALSNAASLRNEDDFSASGKELLRRVRSCSPVLSADRRLDHDLRLLTEAIDCGTLLKEK